MGTQNSTAIPTASSWEFTHQWSSVPKRCERHTKDIKAASMLVHRGIFQVYPLMTIFTAPLNHTNCSKTGRPAVTLDVKG